MADVLYDDGLERKVISYLLKDLKKIETAQLKITEKCFYRKEFVSMFLAIKRAYDKYKVLLTEEMFSKFLEHSLARQIGSGKLTQEAGDEKKQLYVELYKSLLVDEVKEEEFVFTVDELKSLYLKRKMYDVSKEVMEGLKAGKTGDELIKAAEKLVNEAKRDSHVVYIKKRFIHESIDQRIQDYEKRRDQPEAFTGILFGLQSIDELTYGMQKGELGMTFARTGKGKTRFLFNYGYNASKKGWHVMYASLEMYIEQIERMYDSRDARISYTRLKKGSLLKEEEEIYRYVLSTQKKRKDFFYTVDIPRGCTISLLESEIEQYEREFGHKVDLLIVDYLMLMRTSDQWSSTSERLGSIAREMKELARARNMVVFTANQANRGAAEVENTFDIGTEHISLSDQIAPQCDFVNYLEQTDSDKVKNELQDLIIKYRDGAGRPIRHYVNWDLNYLGDQVVKIKGQGGDANGKERI